jgi:hypothetical protein
VGVTVEVGASVGVEVEVEVKVDVTVSVGDGTISAVTIGPVTTVVPPQAVNKKDPPKISRMMFFIGPPVSYVE